jgi:hypothetical protein
MGNGELANGQRIRRKEDVVYANEANPNTEIEQQHSIKVTIHITQVSHYKRSLLMSVATTTTCWNWKKREMCAFEMYWNT